MYIINSHIKKQEHHLTHAILLSPAGLHLNAPFQIPICGFISGNFLQKFINHISFPSFVVDIFLKIHKDIRNLPALSDLLTFIT